jgi:uncharacterized protein (TIGR02996 family)
VTDGEALIRSVLATPADDAPRLVYADWLDEQGRAEDAEFIRVQIELARRGYGGAFHLDELGRTRHAPPDIVRLTLRQMELWFAGHGKPDLPAEMANWPMTVHATPGHNLLIRRGLVERITLFTDVFLEMAGELFARQPVMHVRLVDKQSRETDSGVCWVFSMVHQDALDEVPLPLWDYFWGERDTKQVFATADEAEAALSWACVRYGRAQAGLEDSP